mmetsp:Transcript_4974/g.11865  ORF Transcript_4974/g.11865 Transcript_4974/m.11865 type:complete len:90 (-) Transcript_4974:313-582(-)
MIDVTTATRSAILPPLALLSSAALDKPIAGANGLQGALGGDGGRPKSSVAVAVIGAIAVPVVSGALQLQRGINGDEGGSGAGAHVLCGV